MWLLLSSLAVPVFRYRSTPSTALKPSAQTSQPDAGTACFHRRGCANAGASSPCLDSPRPGGAAAAAATKGGGVVRARLSCASARCARSSGALLTRALQELCELSELDTARALLRQTVVLGALKLSEPERYLRLEHLLLQPRPAWPDSAARDVRRRALAAALAAEVSVVPAARLLALLGQALKWQRHTGQLAPGAPFELLRGNVASHRVEAEACVTGARAAHHCRCSERNSHTRTVEAKCLRFGKKSHAQVACFSPDGQVRLAPTCASRRTDTPPLFSRWSLGRRTAFWRCGTPAAASCAPICRSSSKRRS